MSLRRWLNEELLRRQYDVLAGRFPEKMDEVVIIVNSRSELSDYTPTPGAQGPERAGGPV